MGWFASDGLHAQTSEPPVDAGSSRHAPDQRMGLSTKDGVQQKQFGGSCLDHDKTSGVFVVCVTHDMSDSGLMRAVTRRGQRWRISVAGLTNHKVVAGVVHQGEELGELRGHDPEDQQTR